jgi:hypothetical protein
VVQTYLAFFFPPATAGVSGNLYFHCQSDQTGKKTKQKSPRRCWIDNVKHVIHFAHSFEQFFIFLFFSSPQSQHAS